MENQRESIEMLLANRIHIYEMLHKALGGTPNEELLQLLSSEQAVLAFEILSETEDDMMAKMARFLKKLGGKLESEAEFLENAKNEYTRLFIGPGRLVAYPWRSTYKGKEKMLFTEATLNVREIFKRRGFRAAGYPHVADDHIAIMLHFLTKMAERTLAAFQADDLKRTRSLIKDQKTFLKLYMLDWVPEYATDIRKSKTAHVYPQLVLGTEGFLNVDDSAMTDIAEWLDEAIAAEEAKTEN